MLNEPLTGKPKSGNKKKPRPTVDPGSGDTTGPNADLASGENNVREPSVRNRSLINLTVDDLNWTRSIEGYIQSVELDEKRAVLQREKRVMVKENKASDLELRTLVLLAVDSGRIDVLP